MPVSPEALRDHENHAQNLTLAAMQRADNGLYGFLTNLKNKANIIGGQSSCPKLTFWEWCVYLYDQALLCYCVHSKAHAWLIDTILNVSARVVFSSWVVIG